MTHGTFFKKIFKNKRPKGNKKTFMYKLKRLNGHALSKSMLDK